MTPIKNYENILIFNPSFIGDSVLTTPLIRAVKKIFSNSKVTFCVRPESSSLFQNIDIIDNVLIYDKRGKDKGIKGLIRFSKIITENNFDLVINLHKSIRSTSLFMLSKCGFVVGFSSAVLSFTFNKRVKRNMAIHEVERNLMTLSPLVNDFSLSKAKEIGGSLTCYIDKDIAEKTKDYFSSVSKGKKVVGINVGSVWATKRYPAKYFAEVASILSSKGYDIALYGASSDKDAIDQFNKYYNGSYYDFAYKTSLKELSAFLQPLSLLITNDSGPMHIAICAKVPCVAIFGATVKELGFFPYDEKSVVVEDLSVTCRPCGKHGGNSCPKGHFNCMNNIRPIDIVATSEKLLNWVAL